jgi:hypothetical protein
MTIGLLSEGDLSALRSPFHQSRVRAEPCRAETAVLTLLPLRQLGAVGRGRCGPRRAVLIRELLEWNRAYLDGQLGASPNRFEPIDGSEVGGSQYMKTSTLPDDRRAERYTINCDEPIDNSVDATLARPHLPSLKLGFTSHKIFHVKQDIGLNVNR